MGVIIHYVKTGETLRTIAVLYYGDANVWHEIARLNGIRDPKRIEVGQAVKLP